MEIAFADAIETEWIDEFEKLYADLGKICLKFCPEIIKNKIHWIGHYPEHFRWFSNFKFLNI